MQPPVKQMSFTPPVRRPRAESIVPMINVVFLLLIFFLMTSRLAPPEPFAVAPPTAPEGTELPEMPVLYLSAAGEVGHEDQRGEAAIAAFVAAAGARRGQGEDSPPRLRADAGVEAAELARLLKALTEAGLSEVALVVAQQ